MPPSVIPFDSAGHQQKCMLACLCAQQMTALEPEFEIQATDIITLLAAVTQVGVSAANALYVINTYGNPRYYDPTYLAALAGYTVATGGLVRTLIGCRNRSAQAQTICTGIVAASAVIHDPMHLDLSWPPLIPTGATVPPPTPAPPPQRPSWMADHAAAIGPKRLCDLVLPGTHDSATSDINAGSSVDPYFANKPSKSGDPTYGGYALAALRYVPLVAPNAMNIIANWARNQGLDITAQLNAGIRYLDLRVTLRSGAYWTVHTLYGTPLSTVLAQVSSFLAANPREIVFLDINHLFGIQDYGDLCRFVAAQLGARLAPRSQYSATSRVQDLWAGGHQAVVLIEAWNNVQPAPPLWGQDQISSPWPDTSSLSELTTFLDTAITKRGQNQLFVAQGILGTGLVPIAGLAGMGSTSLAGFASAIGPSIFLLFKQWAYRPLNIVIMDWFTTLPDYVDDLIEMNMHGSLSHSRIDVDDQGGGADTRSFGFDTTGDAGGCTVSASMAGSGPMLMQMTPGAGQQSLPDSVARVKPSGRMVLTSLRTGDYAFVAFNGVLHTEHALQVTNAILSVVPPATTAPGNTLIKGYSNHAEFLVDDQGGGADTRNFVFDTVRQGDGVKVTITYPGSGPLVLTLTKSRPVQGIPAQDAARVKPSGALTMTWSAMAETEFRLVSFSGTLHTEHSVTLSNIGVAILDSMA